MYYKKLCLTSAAFIASAFCGVQGAMAQATLVLGTDPNPQPITHRTVVYEAPLVQASYTQTSTQASASALTASAVLARRRAERDAATGSIYKLSALPDYPETIIRDASIRAEQNQFQPQQAPVITDVNQQVFSYYQAPTPAVVASEYQETDRVYQIASVHDQRFPEGLVQVNSGDTVFALGRRYRVSPNDIIAANNLQAPYHLEIGQALKIPGLASADIRQVARPSVPYQVAPVAQPHQQRPVPAQAPDQTSAPQQYNVQSVSQPVQSALRRDAVHIVRPGDTLYSIARNAKLSVAQIATANNTPAPYTLNIGAQLILPGAGGVVPQAPVATAPKFEDPYQAPFYQKVTVPQNTTSVQDVSYPQKQTHLGRSRFTWPIQGKVIRSFGVAPGGNRNPGINIAAPMGSPIRATEDGEVIYRGSNLPDHGNLLLLKHADGWVSAYGHADALLVRQGEMVRKGQVIGKIGKTGAVNQPQLHFELRYQLQPTDPIAALQGRVSNVLP